MKGPGSPLYGLYAQWQGPHYAGFRVGACRWHAAPPQACKGKLPLCFQAVMGVWGGLSESQAQLRLRQGVAQAGVPTGVDPHQ